MVTKRGYIPDRGDVVWLDFNPTRGHEQRGRRPALVVSPKEYNERAGLALVCPITSRPKGYPFEVTPRAKGLDGVILTDQIRSVDWVERRAKKIISISKTTMIEVRELLSRIILGE